MQATKIEWCNYSCNPIKGWCPNSCSYCYAHAMQTRFHHDKTIRFDKKELFNFSKIKPGSRVFINSMIESYHPDIPIGWMQRIVDASLSRPDCIFISLTKMPSRLLASYPANWWIGVTCEREKASKRVEILRNRNGISRKFVSFEPLLGDCSSVDISGMNYIIIGGLTPKNKHKNEWVEGMIQCARKNNILVFLKNNLNYSIKIQELPLC